MNLRQKAIEKYNYCPDTGNLFYKNILRIFEGSKYPIPKYMQAKSIAGMLNKYGYLLVQVGSRQYLAHRIIWLMVYGKLPKCQIDHINGIKHDNRLENLRDVTGSENKHNVANANNNSKTGALGVSFFINKYKAQIQVNGKYIYLGLFDTIEKARLAYWSKKEELLPNICQRTE